MDHFTPSFTRLSRDARRVDGFHIFFLPPLPLRLLCQRTPPGPLQWILDGARSPTIWMSVPVVGETLVQRSPSLRLRSDSVQGNSRPQDPHTTVSPSLLPAHRCDRALHPTLKTRSHSRHKAPRHRSLLLRQSLEEDTCTGHLWE
jgi:hypothetical protein